MPGCEVYGSLGSFHSARVEAYLADMGGALVVTAAELHGTHREIARMAGDQMMMRSRHSSMVSLRRQREKEIGERLRLAEQELQGLYAEEAERAALRARRDEARCVARMARQAARAHMHEIECVERLNLDSLVRELLSS